MKAWMEAHRITELNEKAPGSKAGRRLAALLTKMRNRMEIQYVGRIFPVPLLGRVQRRRVIFFVCLKPTPRSSPLRNSAEYV